jgi:hypothetical protein
MKRTLVTLVALSSLVGCAVAEEDFPVKAARSSCDRFAECDAGNYSDVYSDDADCEADWADFWEFYLDFGDLAGETYDGRKGRDCLSEIRHADCDAIESGDIDCDVWADE